MKNIAMVISKKDFDGLYVNIYEAESVMRGMILSISFIEDRFCGLINEKIPEYSLVSEKKWNDSLKGRTTFELNEEPKLFKLYEKVCKSFCKSIEIVKMGSLIKEIKEAQNSIIGFFEGFRSV